ncbi:MAG: hypothetical protein LBK94_05790 [Prevotellaceae bacterium]|jgi:hypothetical protein|nr:hypothetical protein [Prevotellaceae bacterium]
MAKSKNNVITYGLSGKIGDLLVFRQVDGKTIVSKIPEQPKTVSEKQKANRGRFQQAVIYAKIAIEAAETKDLYAEQAKKKKGITAYNIAVADFFNAPDIDTVDLSAYAGAAGDVIRIIVSDDFAVKSVHVKISNADGSLVEEGYAVRGAGNLWIYTAVQNNDSLDGDRILITASDLPGNTVSEERSL